MITMSRYKLLSASLAALALAACSSSSDRYGNSSYSSDSYGYYGDSYAGAYQTGQSAGRYGDMTGYNAGSTNCVAGGYDGGYTQTGLRTGRYGEVVTSGGSAGYSGQRSRYGTWESGGSASDANCQSGYWMIPTYQVASQPPPAVTTTIPEPVVTTSVPPVTTVLESCPDGQYRMDNGDCAIMMTEEVEPQYVPPVVTHYPEAPTITEEWYNPIRK